MPNDLPAKVVLIQIEDDLGVAITELERLRGSVLRQVQCKRSIPEIAANIAEKAEKTGRCLARAYKASRSLAEAQHDHAA